MTTLRHCESCGAPVTEDAPCPACALAGAFEALGFNDPVPPPKRFSPLDLPSDFGPYRVEREIAAGGMGMVYEATDLRLGRVVALKMLRRVFFSTALERLRFQSEAELASLLDHPHIVPVHDVGEHEGQPYFSMKLIRGGNLADRLGGSSLPPREAAVMMVKIARAVQHAHERGVLHRDLKPANILLDENGQPMLTDFGLAKWLDSDSGLTLVHAIAGTPDFMSPEQAAGERGAISTATDVWALGVILYQMLTGRLPFHAESHSEILRRVAGSEPPAPRSIRRLVDRDLDTLCLRCLDKEPARRLAGAGALADDLERWLEGEPIHARRINTLQRLGKWTRRHPFRTAALAVFLFLVLGAGAAITWQWRRATVNERNALASAAAERRIAYSATLAQALAAREHHDLGLARRLLNGISPEIGGFGWRLLLGLCRGDDLRAYSLGDGPGAEPQCLAGLPDGERIAIISADGWLHYRDPEGAAIGVRRELPPCGDGGHRYRGLTFSPDGRRLAYAKGDVLQVLDADSLAVIHAETSRLPQFDWLDNERLLYGFNGSVAAPPYPEPGAWILDFRGGAPSGNGVSRTAFPEMCAPLAVSSDRRFFVLHRVESTPDSWARTLHVYAVAGDLDRIPEAAYTLPGRDYPGDVILSRTGKYLALSSGTALRQSARLVEVAGGRLLFDNVFRFPIYGLAIDPQERRLGLVGGDSVVRVYDFTRGRPEGENANSYDDGVDLVRCQPVDGRGVHAPPGNPMTRSAQDGRARFYFGHEKRVFDLRFDSAGALRTVGDDGTVRQWSPLIPRPAVRLGQRQSTYNTFHPAASEDGRQLLYVANIARLCDVARSEATGRDVSLSVATLHAPLAVLRDGSPVTQDRVSSDIVAWRLEDGSLRERRRLPGACPNTFRDGRTRGGALSRDEKHLAGSSDGWLFSADLERGTIAWSGKLGQATSAFAGHDISPDGEWIASSDFGPRVSIHRFDAPDQIVAYLGGAARDYDTAVAFARDGRRLYTGNEDGRIRVWDTGTWQELPELGWSAHRGAVTAIAVSHDRTLMATSGDDTLRLFPIEPEPGESQRRERFSLHLDQAANWIRFARDANGGDRALLLGTPGGTVEVWNASPDAAMAVPPPPDSASLPSPLAAHGAILLPDGKVLVAGGEDIDSLALSDCHLFDPDRGTWRATGSLARPRGRPALTLLPDGRVLAAGGLGRNREPLASCEIYDPETGGWTPTGSLSTPRFDGASLALPNGKVLAAGGRNLEDALHHCELYDPESGLWSETGSLATPQILSAWCVLGDGSVLVAGGMGWKGKSPLCERYTPATGSWRTGGLPLEAALAPATLLPRGEVLVSDQLYDPASDTWRRAAPFPKLRTRHSATLLPGGKVLVAGGQVSTPKGLNTNPAARTCLLYDPATDQWTPAPDLLTPRHSHTATLLPNGKVLLVGGIDEAGGALSAVEVYAPVPDDRASPVSPVERQ